MRKLVIVGEPETVAVAEFLGNPNRLTGVCVERAADRVVVEADGQRIAATAGSDAPQVGDRAIVFVRPESVRIRNGSGPSDESILRATVVRSAFLGDSTEYILSVSDDVYWRLRLDHATRLPVGDAVDLGAPRSACRAFALGGSAEAGSHGPAPAEP